MLAKGGRMPTFSLINDDKSLTALAEYKIFSAMLFPRDRILRERFIAHVIDNSDVIAEKRRAAMSKDNCFSYVDIYAPKASIVGGLLLTRLQLHPEYYPWSQNRAIPLVRSCLPKWSQPTGSSWPGDSTSRSWPLSRRKMLDAWHQFRPVAHLWAALVHVLQHHPALEAWRWGHDLPTFLAFADRLLEMACTLPSPRDGGFVLSRAEAWTFQLPQDLTLTKRLVGLPLDEQQLAALPPRALKA
jgi:hypothetical protein